MRVWKNARAAQSPPQRKTHRPSRRTYVPLRAPVHDLDLVVVQGHVRRHRVVRAHGRRLRVGLAGSHVLDRQPLDLQVLLQHLAPGRAPVPLAWKGEAAAVGGHGCGTRRRSRGLRLVRGLRRWLIAVQRLGLWRRKSSDAAFGRTSSPNSFFLAAAPARFACFSQHDRATPVTS